MAQSHLCMRAARLYLLRMDDTRAFVKLDFRNVIKSIQRDTVLEAVAEHRPDLLAFCVSAYGAPSQLWMADGRQIISDEGVQQGGPLSPLLFSLALNQPPKDTGAEFISGYLDDVGLGDTVPRLIAQIRQLEAAAAKVGLQVNHDKCEVFGFSAVNRQMWDQSDLKFTVKAVEEATLLGSPIHTSGVDSALISKCSQLESD